MSKQPAFKQKQIWFNVVGYRPTAAQLPVHQSPSRHLLIGGGWRGGKSRVTAMEAFACWPFWDLLYIVADKYEQATPEFDYLDASFHLLERVTKARLISRRQRPAHGQGRCSLELVLRDKLKRVVTISTHNRGIQAITARGEAPDMILLVEFESLAFDIYLAARGRVAESRGRLILSGTFPDDTGWQAELWRRWQGDNEDEGQSFSLATWDNTHVFPGGWDDPEIKALRSTYPEAELMRRFGARPQKPATLVFPEFEWAVHVRDFVEFDPDFPVELAIDPGFAGAYAVLAVQRYGPMVWVIDEIYERGRFGAEIVEMAQAREWWDNVPKASRFETGGVIDIAGRQHHAAESQIEIWREKGNVALRSQAVPLRAGRDRLKSFLVVQPDTGLPRLLYSPKCRMAAWEYGAYRWKRGPEERMANEEPIDQNNHAIKAIAYWLYDVFGPVERVPLPMPDIMPRERLWRAVFGMRG